MAAPMQSHFRKSVRTALVFPPAMHPAGPPLGIASLKAYLQSRGPDPVQNFDFNLAYYEQAFQWLKNGRLKMSIQKMDQQATARETTAAREFFRGDCGLESFFDLPRYNRYAQVYTGFGSVLNGLFDNFARRLLLGLPVPPLVREFFSDLIAPLLSYRPDLVGFSVLFSQQLFFALALARLCREAGTKTVLGGATFSIMPDPSRLISNPLVVKIGKQSGLVEFGSAIDFLIVGEGETGLESLRQCIAEGTAGFSRIPGLIRKTDDGLQFNPPRSVADLNSIPSPDFSDFPLQDYHSPLPVLPYLSSRGCPWRRCAFCTHQKTYLEYREEAVGTTAERLVDLKRKYGVSHFCLVDEMIHPHRLAQLGTRLTGKGTGIYFSAYARPVGGFTPELLGKAFGAGLRVLMWGVESGSQRVLTLMGKGTRAETVGKVLDASHRAGVWNLIFVLLGFPTETETEWRNTLDFLERHRAGLDAVSKSQFVLLEGSRVFLTPGEYGITRVIDRPQRDPVSIAYDYEAARGISLPDATRKFRETLPALAGLGRSPYFGQFREHMLIYAARAGKSG